MIASSRRRLGAIAVVCLCVQAGALAATRIALCSVMPGSDGAEVVCNCGHAPGSVCPMHKRPSASGHSRPVDRTSTGQGCIGCGSEQASEILTSLFGTLTQAASLAVGDQRASAPMELWGVVAAPDSPSAPPPTPPPKQH